MREHYQFRLKDKKAEAFNELLSQLKGDSKQEKLENIVDFLLNHDRQNLLELVLNVLGLNSHLSSSDSSPILSPKRSEEEQGLPQETQSVLDSEIPCFCRYEHNGLLWCANRPPTNSGKITTLKRCGACLKRITKDKISSGLRVKTRYYATCGAREHYDKKKGLMLYCSKHFQGQWVTPKDCQTAKCLYIKEVKTEDG